MNLLRTAGAGVIDTIADRTVVAGYANLGYALRSGSWDPAELRPMGGKVVLVTGATSGIGFAAAEGFARLGASVWLLARDRRRGERARAAIAAGSRGADVRLAICDLSDLESIRNFAEDFTAAQPRLDVLVNNAGVLPSERTLSPDGVELTFATNVLGPFLLTNLLIPRLLDSAPSRILNVSSGGMYTQRIHVEDLQSGDDAFDGPAAYARSKRAEVILTELWAERLKGTGVVAHAMHPGWVDTPGVESSLPRFHRLARPLLRTPGQGADTIVWLGAAEAPGLSTGRFWQDRRARPTHRVPWTRETAADRERLWRECERLSARRGEPAAASRAGR